MKKIILKDTLFWKWMDGDRPYTKTGVSYYINKIAKLMGSAGYLAQITDHSIPSGRSEIMDKLSLAVPRRYFLEVQYCAKAYATFFGSIFPTLAANVDQLAYIEWLLYTEPSNPAYRDHLVHMFKVAFVCGQLLSIESLLSTVAKSQFESEHFLRWCDSQNISISGRKDRETVLKIALFLAALFHDFGYGYYFHSKYRAKLFKVNQWLLPEANTCDTNTWGTRMILQSLPSAFIKKCHAWLKSNNPKNEHNIIAGFYRDCAQLNHSIASTFFTIDVAENLNQSGALSQQLYVAFQLAAEACMIHDMTKIGTWAHLQKKKNGHFLDCRDHKNIPLAMLLILADELSIWNRPTLKMEMDGDDSVAHRLDRSNVPRKIEISITERKRQNIIKIVPDQAYTTIKKTFSENLSCLKNKIDQNTHPRLFGYRIDVGNPNNI